MVTRSAVPNISIREGGAVQIDDALDGVRMAARVERPGIGDAISNDGRRGVGRWPLPARAGKRRLRRRQSREALTGTMAASSRATCSCARCAGRAGDPAVRAGWMRLPACPDPEPQAAINEAASRLKRIGRASDEESAFSASEHDCRQTVLRRTEEAWWARQGLNLRPPRCEHGALPLSYAPTPVPAEGGA